MSRLNHADIGSAVRADDDIYRVYRPEWIVVHTISSTAGDVQALLAEAEEYFTKGFAGRVREQDVTYEVVTFGPVTVVRLKLRMPNIIAEWKTFADAEQFVKTTDLCDAEIVARNSKRDHQLRGYGITKLAG